MSGKGSFVFISRTSAQPSIVMFKRLFGTEKSGGSGAPSSGTTQAGGGNKQTPLGAVEQLKDTLSMLEKREALLHKKMAAELGKAREFNRVGKKRSALQCLKKKKLYEQQVDNLQNHQLKLEEQVITLEGSKTTAETFSALKNGAGAMKALNRDSNIDEVDRVMDEINEQADRMRQVQEALGQPVGYAADLDEDELDAELAELEAEDLERELGLADEMSAPPVAVASRQTPPAGLSMASLPSAPSSVANRTPSLPSVPGKSEEDAELEALQREMELLA